MAPNVSRKDPFWEAGLRGKLEQKLQHWLVPRGSEGKTPGPERPFSWGSQGPESVFGPWSSLTNCIFTSPRGLQHFYNNFIEKNETLLKMPSAVLEISLDSSELTA